MPPFLILPPAPHLPVHSHVERACVEVDCSCIRRVDVRLLLITLRCSHIERTGLFCKCSDHMILSTDPGVLSVVELPVP